MSAKPKPKPNDPEQSRRFIVAAKQAGVDETGEVFERAVEKITRRPQVTKPAK